MNFPGYAPLPEEAAPGSHPLQWHAQYILTESDKSEHNRGHILHLQGRWYSEPMLQLPAFFLKVYSYITPDSPLICGFCLDDAVYGVPLLQSDGYAPWLH